MSRIRRLISPFLLVGSAWLPTALLGQQIGPPGTGGIAALEQALSRLDQSKRVLVVGAHPDDEDTELLTLLSRGMGVDVAYLSLSRGEGGQNLIGPELGEQLGLIRTGELLAARSVDGARQYFTRAFDFGFSKTLAETQRFWPHDSILADVLGVIRQFQPQVIIAIFRGTPRDGHGQHQMSAVVVREAFELLRDSAWGPVKLYRGARFDSSANPLAIPNSSLDPFDGRSYLQIAMASRSLHRSQDMGQLQRLGPSAVRVELTTVNGRRLTAGARPDGGLFAGVDTSLADASPRYLALVDSARRSVDPRNLTAVLPVLVAAWRELRGSPRARMAKEVLLGEAIAAAAGVVVDATVNDGRVAPGESLRLAATVWNTGGATVTTGGIEVQPGVAGWRVRPAGTTRQLDGGAGFFSSGRVPVTEFVLEAPATAQPTTPYFLERRRVGELYDWPSGGLRGAPLDAPVIRVLFRLTIGGADVALLREAAYRYNEQAFGEVRKPVVIVPTISVFLTPESLVWPAGVASHAFQVELVNGRRDTVSGFVRLVTPEGWPAVAPQPFTLAGDEDRRAFTFAVRAPASVPAGSYVIRAVADVEGGSPQSRASITIDYPHIRPMTWVKDAVSRVEAASVALPRLRLVGYVRGASDRVPEALESVGLPVSLLSPDQLERGDLSAYDVIVIGSRAYETDPALVANNPRLLEWVRGGGRLIVQYQQYQFVSGRGGAFAPFPLTMARPHDRVTDETAPVTALDPSHRLFTTPNAIGAADWDHWVQERGLYFAHEWDPAYQPLLELGDNGERLRGGLLLARYGRGLYVYTGLAFFRQLPAGVPGAYRLFLNLLALRPDDVP